MIISRILGVPIYIFEKGKLAKSEICIKTLIPNDKKIEINCESFKWINELKIKIIDKNIIGPIMILTKILVMMKYIPITLKW